MSAMLRALIIVTTWLTLVSAQYKPTWESLDSRPNPPWYDDAKFGIFIHWGLFSVPSFGSEWFWYRWEHDKNPAYVEFMKDNYPPGFQYADFASMFRAEFYDPNAWADLLSKSGARYVVLTSKHHEGWTNWRSNASWNWNSVDNGPHRDLVGDFAQAIRTHTNITLGLYHSLFEWFNPLYLSDAASGFKKQDYVKQVLMPELYDLINTFKPDYLWTDGSRGPDTYWGSTEFLAWLYNDSPVKDSVVTNDRWCNNGCLCHHGGVYTCRDHYNPGHVIKHKWENCMRLDKVSWGYVRNSGLENYSSMPELLYQLSSTVSCGGNFLLNVGPTADGRIIPAFQERLLQMGEWLGVNGEAIYGTKPWRAQNDTVNPDVWYTSKAGAVYAIVLKWPGAVCKLGAPVATKETKVTMLGYSEELSWKSASDTGGILVSIPAIPVSELPSVWAWVLKMSNIK